MVKTLGALIAQGKPPLNGTLKTKKKKGNMMSDAGRRKDSYIVPRLSAGVSQTQIRKRLTQIAAAEE